MNPLIADGQSGTGLTERKRTESIQPSRCPLVVVLLAFHLILATGASSAVSPVARTGVEECWDADGNAISCAGTGQDGELQRGLIWPSPRFTDHGDGTVIDNLTGLIWLQDANCFGARTWDQALSDANSLSDGQCGLADGSVGGDWSLANVNELRSLMSFGDFFPVIARGHPFIAVDVGAIDNWTSTTGSSTGNAIWVSFGDGTTLQGLKTESHAVWPVRAGQFIYVDAFESGGTSAWMISVP